MAMTPEQIENWQVTLRERGPAVVREMVEMGRTTGQKLILAEMYLRELEAQEEEDRRLEEVERANKTLELQGKAVGVAEEANRIAKEANVIAKRARIWAAISVLVAAIALNHFPRHFLPFRAFGL